MSENIPISEEEIAYIKDNFWLKTKREIANDLNIKTKRVSYICEKLHLTKSWEYDDKTLFKYCDGTRTYLDLHKLLPHRTRDAIEYRCQLLKINNLIKRENSEFTIQEIEKFKQDFPIFTDEYLMVKYNKSYNQIRRLAGTLKLRKSLEILHQAKINNSLKAVDKNNTTKDNMNSHKKNVFKNMDEYNDFIYKVKNIFINKSSILEIINKYNHLELSYIRKQILKYHNISFSFDNKEEIICINNNNSELVNSFKVYKEVLLNKKQSIGNIVSIKSKETVKILFKYSLYINKIKDLKSFLINCNYGQYLEDIKLKGFVKSNFNGYYDFVTFCFPNLKLKPWDFKVLDVENNWYNSRSNRLWFVRDIINKLKLEKVISTDLEVLKFPYSLLIKYFGNSLDLIYGIKNAIFEYLDYIHVNYRNQHLKYYKGIRFDSFEEMMVYILLNNLGLNVKKLNKKFKLYNKKFNEYYIPDFTITFNDIIIYCEYYGLFKENENVYSKNKILKMYYYKTLRKNEFYAENINYFLPIYPSNNRKNFYEYIEDQVIQYFYNNFNVVLTPIEGGDIEDARKVYN